MMKNRALIWAFTMLCVVGSVFGVFKAFGSKEESRRIPIAKIRVKKPFVIIIPSYNNSEWCERNLRSVLTQKYDNYRVIYINDASTDVTLIKAKQIVKELGKEERVTFVDNKINQGAVANIYRAVHSCRDEEIVVNVDGDDWLKHDQVLRKLNAVYASPKVWLTYGNYCYYPTLKKGECAKKIPMEVLNKNKLREYMGKKGFVLSHLRTFYAGLYKQIKLEDLLFYGKFFPASADSVMMVPMVEMAREHAFCIKECLYVNNRANPLNDDKLRGGLQQECWELVKEGKPYSPVVTWKTIPVETKGDLIIFSFDRPLQLYALLESTEKYVKNVNLISVIYRASNEAFAKAYESVIEVFPHVNFVKQGENPSEDFKPLTLKVVKDGVTDFVLFAVDDMIVKEEIDLKEAIAALRKTKAYGFYFRLGSHVDYCYMLSQKQGIPEALSLQNGVFAWQFLNGKGDWRYPNTVDMTLYKKADILADLEKMKYTHPGKLEAKWASRAHLEKMGLFYANSKVVNTPLNLVINSTNRQMNSFTTLELLEKFEQGLKMDIAPLHQIKNISAHMDLEPTFILR